MAKAWKAWHITNYDELFRAKDTGGRIISTVKYAQDIMGGWDEYSSQYLIKMEVLEAELGFEQFATAKYLFMQMLKHSHRFSGERLIGYRGYILDERLRSPGPEKIATLCRCPAALVKRYLPLLEKVGLIERVNLPALSPGGRPPDEPGEKPKERVKRSTAKAKKNAGGWAKGGYKRAAQTSCGTSTARFKKDEDKAEDKTRPSASAETEDKTRPSASAEGKGPAAASPPQAAEGKTQEETESTANRAAAAAQVQADKPNAEGQAKGNLGPHLQALLARLSPTAHSPTATPPSADVPSLPGETDAMAAGSSSLNPHDREAEVRLIRQVERQRRLANAAQFADEIYAAIREPQSKNSPHGAREYGVFYAFWQEVMQRRLGIEAMDVLWDKCIASAGRIGKKRNKCKSPGAVWRHEAGQRLANPFGKDSGKSSKFAVK